MSLRVSDQLSFWFCGSSKAPDSALCEMSPPRHSALRFSSQGLKRARACCKSPDCILENHGNLPFRDSISFVPSAAVSKLPLVVINKSRHVP